MAFSDLPSELLHKIFQKLKDHQRQFTNPISNCPGTYIPSLMSLRQSCKRLNLFATPILFEQFTLLPREPSSWVGISKISRTKDIARHLSVLVLDFTWHSASVVEPPTDHARLDLASLPNLKKIKTNCGLHFQKKAVPSSNQTQTLYLEFYNTKNSYSELGARYTWLDFFIPNLAEVGAAYGFEIDGLTLAFPRGYSEITSSILQPGMSFQHLKSVTLYLDCDHDAIKSLVLPFIINLPYIVSLSILQAPHPRPGRIPGLDAQLFDGRNAVIADIVNIIEALGNHHWPMLRHLHLELPRTTVVDLKTFLSLYQDQLETLHIHGGIYGIGVPPYETDYSAGNEMDSNTEEDVDSTNFYRCGAVLKGWIEREVRPGRFTTTAGDWTEPMERVEEWTNGIDSFYGWPWETTNCYIEPISPEKVMKIASPEEEGKKNTQNTS